LPVALAAALLALPALALAGSTLYVNDGGADCAFAATHATIQAAVDAAPAARATKIHVCPGTYSELVTIAGFRKLTLEGEPGTTVRPPGPAGSVSILRVEDSRKVILRGLAVDGDLRFTGMGIFASGIRFADSSGRIEGCSIFRIRPEPLAASFSHAIDVFDNDPLDEVPVRIVIRDNDLGDYGSIGIDVSAAAKVTIVDNVLTGRGPTMVEPQIGIILREAARGRVASNTIDLHWFTPFRAASGLDLEGSSRIRVEHNSFTGDYDAIEVEGSAAAARRNRITGNDISGAEFGISIEGNAGAPAEANQVVGNRVGASASGVTGITISGDAFDTRVKGNAVLGFAAAFDDAGSGTRYRGNTCDGVPCP
jgi:nitrous oxidase accessory protein NosD